MSDLVQLLRGYRIDARQPEEVMRQAADELDRLNAQTLELCAEISGLRRENEKLSIKVDTLQFLLNQRDIDIDGLRRALAGAAVQPSACLHLDGSWVKIEGHHQWEKRCDCGLTFRVVSNMPNGTRWRAADPTKAAP